MIQAVKKRGIPIVAHRGCVNLEPENTLEAFQRAVEIGADAIELDIRQTGDGEFVIIHDETVDRTTSGSGNVNEMSLQETKRLEIDGGYEIPTLSQALTFFSDVPVDPWFEIKESGIADEVVDAITRVDLAGHPVLFASHGFIDEVLEAAQRAGFRAGISVGPTIAGRYAYDTLDPVTLADEQGFGAILVTPENLNESLVYECLERSIELSLVIDI